jgi:hypothetical protein
MGEDLSYGDAVAAALHADAEAARAEIREAGITCPSCGVNLADLADDHDLAMEGAEGGVRCQAGALVIPSGIDQVTDALTVIAAKSAERAWMREVIGEPGGEPRFTGLLDVLEGS